MANIIRSASLWLKIATAAVLLGFILFIIGFATQSWMVRENAYAKGGYGLWGRYQCRHKRSCSSASYTDINDYHRAIQAMECLGLIGFFFATVIPLLYMLLDSARRRDFLQAATAATFGGLLFACIGFALFGSTSNVDNHFGLHNDIGWSMGIAIAGSVFYGLAGVMLIIQLIR